MTILEEMLYGYLIPNIFKQTGIFMKQAHEALFTRTSEVLAEKRKGSLLDLGDKFVDILETEQTAIFPILTLCRVLHNIGVTYSKSELVDAANMLAHKAMIKITKAMNEHKTSQFTGMANLKMLSDLTLDFAEKHPNQNDHQMIEHIISRAAGNVLPSSYTRANAIFKLLHLSRRMYAEQSDNALSPAYLAHRFSVRTGWKDEYRYAKRLLNRLNNGNHDEKPLLETEWTNLIANHSSRRSKQQWSDAVSCSILLGELRDEPVAYDFVMEHGIAGKPVRNIMNAGQQPKIQAPRYRP